MSIPVQRLSKLSIKVIYLSISLSICLPVGLSVSLFACLSVCLSAACLSIYHSIHLYVCMYTQCISIVTCQIFIRHLLVTLTLKVRIKNKKYTIVVEASINQFGLFACSQIYTMKYIGTPSCNCCCLNNARNFCN